MKTKELSLQEVVKSYLIEKTGGSVDPLPIVVTAAIKELADILDKYYRGNGINGSDAF